MHGHHDEEEPTGIEITKVDAQTGAPIAGVEFILSAGKSEGCQEGGQEKDEASPDRNHSE